jgi:hypothetical protein
MKVIVGGEGVGAPVKELENFEKLQAVVRTIQKTAVVRSIIDKENEGEVSYGGYNIRINDCVELTARIPSLLEDMCRDLLAGKVYSVGDSVFLEPHARRIIFFLAWLCSIGAPGAPTSEDGAVLIGIKVLIMRRALDKLLTIMEDVGVCSSSDRGDVKQCLKSLA